MCAGNRCQKIINELHSHKIRFFMKAIETNGFIDDKGAIILTHALEPINHKVKVIVLFEEAYETADESWLKAMAGNTAFSFLAEPGEDVYTPKDGKPFPRDER